VRQRRQPGRRWLPERRLILGVDGGFAAVSLALAGVQSRVAMGSRWHWEAAREHPPESQPPGQREHGDAPVLRFIPSLFLPVPQLAGDY
jgi:hypothetical protein